MSPENNYILNKFKELKELKDILPKDEYLARVKALQNELRGDLKDAVVNESKQEKLLDTFKKLLNLKNK